MAARLPLEVVEVVETLSRLDSEDFVEPARSLKVIYAAADGVPAWWENIRSHKLLSAAEERELARRIQRGDKAAREHLVESNFRLVLHYAVWHSRHTRTTISLSDFFQEGCVGLMTAAGRFNPRRNCRFATYAVPWVRQAMQRALQQQGKTIREPAHVFQRRGTAQRWQAEMTQSLGRVPTLDEMVGSCPAKLRPFFTKPIVMEMLSLDALIVAGSEETFCEAWPDDSLSVAANIELKEMRCVLQKTLDLLPPKLSQVLRWRFGLNGEKELTLQAIADRLEVHIETVRRLEKEGLSRLREVPALRAAVGVDEI